MEEGFFKNASSERPPLREYSGRRWSLPFLLLVALSFSFAGCATAPPRSDTALYAAYQEANDPIEPLNRYFLELTNFADFLLLRPAAEIYQGIAPKPMRRGIRNFVGNLGEPLTFGHDLLQAEFRRAGQSLFRFIVNSTLGLVGLVDVAYYMGVPGHSEDAGQTLAIYGVPEGPYIFLPFMGPSSLRATTGRAIDYFADPVGYIPIEDRRFIRLVSGALNTIDFRASTLDALDQVERTSIDYYVVLRELYRQNRRKEIANGKVNISALPSISDDDFGFDEEN